MPLVASRKNSVGAAATAATAALSSSDRTPLQERAQELPGVRLGYLRDLLRRADGDHLAARLAALRPEVDDPVGLLDHVEVVLDHEHRVPGVDEPLQHLEQLLDVGEVQTRGRLVEDVERLAGGNLAELG